MYTADGLNACFYFLIPLIGLSVFLTVIFVKKVPLKRADDADKKAEAKAWVEEKKRKRAVKSGKLDSSEERSTENSKVEPGSSQR